MTDKEKIQKLKVAFENTIWMSIRYAHGRSTYAPSDVRNAINEFQKVFPDWKPQKDKTIEPPEKAKGFESDYLHDLVN